MLIGNNRPKYQLVTSAFSYDCIIISLPSTIRHNCASKSNNTSAVHAFPSVPV